MIIWILSIVAIEAITEIIASSDLFFAFRNYMKKVNPRYLGKLFSCGYCLSVWLAIPFAFLVPGEIFNRDLIYDLICKWFVLHRLSNIWHEGISRWLKRVPFTMIFYKSEIVPEQPQENQEEKINVRS